MHVEGGGPVNIAKKKNSQQQTVLRRDSVMLAACLKGYQEVIRDVHLDVSKHVSLQREHLNKHDQTYTWFESYLTAKTIRSGKKHQHISSTHMFSIK